MKSRLVNLVVAAAVAQLVAVGGSASAQEKAGDTPAAPAAPVPAQASEPAPAKIQGQAVAEELEKLYEDLLLDYINGRGGSIDELLQVHRMAIEARELGGADYRRMEIAWWEAATERASQLTKILEQRFKAGDLSRTTVRIARANLELTEAKHAAAEAAAQAAVRAERAAQGALKAAQSAAKAARASSRRVVLPPAPR